MIVIAQHLTLVLCCCCFLIFSKPFGVWLLDVVFVQKINFEKVTPMHTQVEYFSIKFC